MKKIVHLFLSCLVFGRATQDNSVRELLTDQQKQQFENTNFYVVIGGPEKISDALKLTDDQVRKLYKKTMMKWHPDRFPGIEKDNDLKRRVDYITSKLEESKSILTNKKIRSYYNLVLKEHDISINKTKYTNDNKHQEDMEKIDKNRKSLNLKLEANIIENSNMKIQKFDLTVKHCSDNFDTLSLDKKWFLYTLFVFKFEMVLAKFQELHNQNKILDAEGNSYLDLIFRDTARIIGAYNGMHDIAIYLRNCYSIPQNINNKRHIKNEKLLFKAANLKDNNVPFIVINNEIILNDKPGHYFNQASKYGRSLINLSILHAMLRNRLFDVNYAPKGEDPPLMQYARYNNPNNSRFNKLNDKERDIFISVFQNSMNLLFRLNKTNLNMRQRVFFHRTYGIPLDFEDKLIITLACLLIATCISFTITHISLKKRPSLFAYKKSRKIKNNPGGHFVKGMSQVRGTPF